MMDHLRRNDEMMWNHTSALMSVILQPYVKKGTRLKPEQFHPYSMSRKYEPISPEEIEEAKKRSVDIIKQIERIQKEQLDGNKRSISADTSS